MHPKAKNRIALLAGVGTAIVLVGGSFYAYRKISIRQEFATMRAEGLAASSEGRHAEAVQKLEKFIARTPNDVEALSAFATSRVEVPAPRNTHLINAANALKRVVGIEPNRIDDQSRLCALLQEIGQFPESLELADRVLQARPDDQRALGTRTTVLLRLKRNPEAAAAAKKWAETAPNDPRAMLASLGAAAQNGATSADIKILIEGLEKRATSDLARAVLRSAVAASDGKTDEARVQIRLAASLPVQSESDVQMVASHMESLGLLEETAAYLTTAADKGLIKGGKLIPARRLLEIGRWDLLANLLSSDPTDPTVLGYRELRALRVMALAGSGNLPDAKSLATEMKKDATKAGVGWSTLLDLALSEGQPPRPEQIVAIATDAVREGETSPLLYLLLADAYARTGETERAIQIYDDIARRSSTWSRPLVRKAALQASAGQLAAAWDTALAACNRPSRDTAAVVTFAEIWTAAVATGVRKDSDELNKFLAGLSDELKKGNDFTVVPSRVLSLARAGRVQEAKTAIQEVKAKATEKPGAAWAPILLRLASISAGNRLGEELPLLDLAEAQAGVTANSALTRSLIIASSGKTEQGLAEFQSRFPAGITDPTVDAGWRLARAQLLTALGDEAASAAWVEVADKYPNDLAIQNETIRSASIRRDVELRRRVIDRLKKSTPTGTGIWRLAEVRLLLDTSSDSRELSRAADDLNEYVRRFPTSIDARMLLALCLERIGSTGAAIEQLKVVVRQDREMRSASLLLAELMQKRGDFAGAGQLLDETLSRNTPGSSERRGIASLLANQGDPDRAISLLEADSTRGGSDILLARLYRQRGDLRSAETEILKVVKDSPDLGSIRLLAEILRAQGKVEDAEKALSRLSELKLEPGVVELARADYHIKFLEIPQALAAATRATEIAPANAYAWQTVATVRAASGDIEGALTTLENASAKIPNNPLIESQRAQAPLIRRAVSDPITRPLVSAFMQRPEDTVLLEALKTPTSGAPSEGGPGPSLVRVRQLAQRYPLSQPIQMFAARRLMQFGLNAEAGQIAARAAQAFPTSPEPAAIAASAFAAAQDWPQTLTYTRLWRSRSATDSLIADLAISEALLRLERPAEVVSTLSIYVHNFSQDPRALLPTLFRTAEAHTVVNRFDLAAALLDPHFKGKPDLLTAWIGFAYDRLPPALSLRWNQLISTRPDASNPNIQWELARTTALGLGRLNDPAAPAARKALADLASSPNHGSGHLLVAAVAYDEAKDYPQAQALYEAALKAEPGNPIILNNLAMLLVNAKGDLAKAESLAADAVKAADSAATFHDTLASVLYARGLYSRAETSARKAVELEPSNPEWWVHLAEIQLADSRKDAARETLAGVSIIPRETLAPALQQRLAQATSAASQRGN